MKQEITKSMFRDEFKRCGRGDQFSYEALGALYDYLENVFDGDYELDVIALCCEYAEEERLEVLRMYRGNMEAVAENTIWHDRVNDMVLYTQF